MPAENRVAISTFWCFYDLMVASSKRTTICKFDEFIEILGNLDKYSFQENEADLLLLNVKTQLSHHRMWFHYPGVLVKPHRKHLDPCIDTSFRMIENTKPQNWVSMATERRVAVSHFTVARSPSRKRNFRKCPISVRMNDHYIRPKIALCYDRHTKFWLLSNLKSRLNRERKSSIISTVHWISAMKKFKNDRITSTECLPNSSKKHIYYVKNYLASLDRSWWSQLTTNWMQS